jgi:hypothetical protein
MSPSEMKKKMIWTDKAKKKRKKTRESMRNMETSMWLWMTQFRRHPRIHGSQSFVVPICPVQQLVQYNPVFAASVGRFDESFLAI